MDPRFQPPSFEYLQHARANGIPLDPQQMPDTEGGPTITGEQLQPHGYEPPVDPIAMPFEAPSDREQEATSRDAEEAELVGRLEDDWLEASTWMAPTQELARKCHAYYDNVQWTATLKSQRLKDGMPSLVMNKIARAIDNVTGRERATRYDWKAAPMGSDEVLAADAMTHGLKAISNQTQSKYVLSDAVEDAAIGGYGVMDVYHDESSPEDEELHVDKVPWEEWYFDPFSRDRGLKDARYAIWARILDLDVAKQLWPAKAEELEAAVTTYALREKQSIQGDYDNTDDGSPHVGYTGGISGTGRSRPRVLVREHRYWVLEPAEWWRMPDGQTVMWDESQPQLMAQAQANGGEFMRGHKRCYYVATVANEVLLDVHKSKLPFPGFGYVVVWCKRDRDGRPYGLVALMLDAQDEINVNLSRANEAIRSRHLIYRPGALGTTTADQAAGALAKSTFVLEVADPDGVKIGTDAADATMYIDLMDRAESFLDDVIGNNEVAYGDQGNEKSGVAIQARAAQQSVTLGKLFENIKYARLTVGEQLIALMQKHYTPQKLLRIIHANVVKTAGVGVNALGQQRGQMPDLSWLKQAITGPIMQLKYDVQIEDAGETATARQAEMQQRTELMGVVPEQFKGPLLPGLLRSSDWSGAEELAGQVEQLQQAASQPQGPDIREYLNIDAAKCLSHDQMQWLLQQLGVPPTQIPPGAPGSSVEPPPPQAPVPGQPPQPTAPGVPGGFSMPHPG